MNIREKIKGRLDELETLMKMQIHLQNPELVMEKLESVTKFWSVLSEDEREYISATLVAIRESLDWK